MHRAIARGGLLALLALLTSQALPAQAAQPAAVVRSTTASLQKHRWPARSFTANTTLQIGKRQWHGSRAVESWWQSQFRLGLQISLASGVTVRGGRAEAVLRRTSRGECAKTCWYRATWQLQGSRIQKMTLVGMARPPASGPPSTVPPPPTSGPPRGTPTIPS